jgi:hypothetical protein
MLALPHTGHTRGGSGLSSSITSEIMPQSPKSCLLNVEHLAFFATTCQAVQY